MAEATLRGWTLTLGLLLAASFVQAQEQKPPEKPTPEKAAVRTAERIERAAKQIDKAAKQQRKDAADIHKLRTRVYERQVEAQQQTAPPKVVVIVRPEPRKEAVRARPAFPAGQASGAPKPARRVQEAAAPRARAAGGSTGAPGRRGMSAEVGNGAFFYGARPDFAGMRGFR